MNYTPLLLDSGDQAFIGNNAIFSFELAWLKIDGFFEMVAREWASISVGDNAMEIWQNKIRHLRQYLRGWARNLCGQYKIEKDRLLNIVEILDCKAETVPLDAQERHTMRKANDDLAKVRRDEESKWALRAKVKHVQQGGDNTK
jgi:hypothetical protein